jgi:hypothetical protein
MKGIGDIMDIHTADSALRLNLDTETYDFVRFEKASGYGGGLIYIRRSAVVAYGCDGHCAYICVAGIATDQVVDCNSIDEIEAILFPNEGGI